MKTKIAYILIAVGIIGAFLFTHKYTVKDSDYLYDMAVNYLQENAHAYSWNKDKEDWHLFASYVGMGIEQDFQYKYVYMMVRQSAYYVDNGELHESTGGIAPYKFKFEGEKIVGYETPEKDGNEYAPSVKKIFPRAVSNKILKLDSSLNEKLNEDMEKQVNAYYDYLNNTI